MMKRLFALSFILLLVSFLYGQNTLSDSLLSSEDTLRTHIMRYNNIEDPYKIELPQILHPSPTAMQYMRYGEIPVSLSTGIPEISVPIYTIKANGLSIPINISYHASGIKMNDIASTIGLGWVLNAGGMIAQTVYSGEDLHSNYLNLSQLPFKSSMEAQTLLNKDWNNNKSYDAYGHLEGWLDRKWDAYRTNYEGESGYMYQRQNVISDRYSFNFNGKNGVFRFNLATGKYETLPYSSLKIEINEIKAGGAISEFLITDENGVKWLFVQRGYTSSRSAEQKIQAKEYQLSEIRFPGQEDVVSFEYFDGTEYSMCNYSESVMNGTSVEFDTYYFLSEPHSASGTEFPKLNIWSGPFSYRPHTNQRTKSMSVTDNKPVYIKSIRWKDTKIEFNYLADRADHIKERLTGIKVYIGSVMVNNTKLNQDLSGRMTLKTIEVNEDLYSFKYNGKMPDLPISPISVVTAKFSEDFWGYYNGANSDKLVPYEWSLISGSPFKWSKQYLSIREPNPSYTKIGILTEITYPTKGKTVFEFEQNRGENVYNDISLSQHETNYFGGLRLAKMTNYDETGNVTNLKTYEYYGGPTVTLTPEHFTYTKDGCYTVGNNIARFIAEPQFGTMEYGVSGTGAPFTELGGQTAFYNKVIEYNGYSSIGGGKTEYTFDRHTYPEFCSNINQELSSLYDCDKGVISPLLISKKEYEYKLGEYILKRETNNEYSAINKGSFIIGIDTKHLYNFNPGINCPEMGMSVSGNSGLYNIYYQNFIFNDIYGIRDISILDKTTETLYSANGSTTEITKYQYAPDHKILNPTEIIKTTSANGDIIIERRTYPFNYIGFYPYNNMLSKNILTPVVSTSLYKNNTLLKTIKNDYIQKGELFLIDKISSSKENKELEERILFYVHDIYGNPVSLSKDEANNIIYLWGYRGKYPIAEILNSTYNDVKIALGNISPESLSLSDSPNMSLIESLREKLKDAHVSTFYYNAFGLKESYDPSGIKTVYDYDDLGRLINIKDQDNYVLSSYQYGYSNRTGDLPNSTDGILNVYINAADEYEIGSNVSFTPTVNGSGNYKYNWSLKDADGNIVANETNTSNKTFLLNFDKLGSYTLTCAVEDVQTKYIGEFRKYIDIVKQKQKIYFANVKNSPTSSTAEIICESETEILFTINFQYTGSAGGSGLIVASGKCIIGNKEYNYTNTSQSQTVTHILPVGKTPISISHFNSTVDNVQMSLTIGSAKPNSNVGWPNRLTSGDLLLPWP